MTLFRLLGFVTLSALILSAIAICPGSSFGAFLDFPSIVLVVGGTVGVMMIACDMRDWQNAGLILLGPRKSLDPIACLSAARFFSHASRAAIAMGVIGQLMGMIIMLGQLNDPDALGPGMAISLISVLYGLGLSELFFVPMQTTAISRAESSDDPSVGRAVPLVLMLFVIFSIGTFGILMLSMLQ